MKIVTYTAICGDIDRPRTDIPCITDYAMFRDPRRNSRTVKILSHLFVDADVSIWVDGNVKLLVPPTQLVEMAGAAEVAVFRHCERTDIYEEGDKVLKVGKDTADKVLPQLQRYRSMGWDKPDLGMCFLIVRRHTERVKRLNEQWFAELCRYSVRDQLSFPVVFDGVVKYWPALPLQGRTPYYLRNKHGVGV